MSLIPPWLRPPRVRERLASYHLRSDVLDAAAAMASDQRSDIYVVRLEAALTDSETVLRMMDGRHARVMGLLVLTSERILFRSRRRTGPNFSVPLEEVRAIQAYTRRGTGTVRVITPYDSLTVDQILGRQGEMLANDARDHVGRTSAGPRPAPAIGRTPRTTQQRRDQRRRVRDPQIRDLARHLGDRSGRQRSTILASTMRKMLTPHKTTLRPVGGSPITETRCVPRQQGARDEIVLRVVIVNGLAATLFLIGYVLLGIAMLRTATLPRWSGVLVAMGAPAHLLRFGIAQLVSTSAWPIAILGSVSLGRRARLGRLSALARTSQFRLRSFK